MHSYGEGETDPSWHTSVVFSPDSRRVVVAQEHLGVATMFDAGTGRLLRPFRLTPGQTMSAAAFTPDGRTLAAAVSNPRRRAVGPTVGLCSSIPTPAPNGNN